MTIWGHPFNFDIAQGVLKKKKEYGKNLKERKSHLASKVKHDLEHCCQIIKKLTR